MSEVLIGQQSKLTSAEQGLLTWVKLHFKSAIAESVEGNLAKSERGLRGVSMTEEHRIRQEARNRGVELTR